MITERQWNRIKDLYVLAGGVRVARLLAKSYGIAHTTITRRAHREGWLREPKSGGESAYVFVYSGRKFDPRALVRSGEGLPWLREHWNARIADRAKREVRFDYADIVSAWNLAAIRAATAYNYGGEVGFEKLLNLHWGREITNCARRETQNYGASDEEQALVAMLPVELRPFALARLRGETKEDIAVRFGLSAVEVKAYESKVKEETVKVIRGGY